MLKTVAKVVRLIAELPPWTFMRPGSFTIISWKIKWIRAELSKRLVEVDWKENNQSISNYSVEISNSQGRVEEEALVYR